MSQQGSDRLNLRVFSVAFLIIILVNLYLFQGMYHALIFASILAGTFYPLYRSIKEKLKTNPEISASLTTFIICISIVIPLIFIIFQVSKETVSLYENVKAGMDFEKIRYFLFEDGPVANFINRLADSFGVEVDLPSLYGNLLTKAQSYGGKVFGTINTWLSDTLSFIFSFIIMLLATFTLFVEGERLKIFAFKLSPLPDDQEQMILEKFSQMNYVTLVCNGIGGLIQGILAGIAMWACGFSSIFLWSTVMVILAFIPLLGISIITIPATIYLFAQGQSLSASLFLIFTMTMALVVENWFKPKFMGKRIKVNSLLVLFYIIAGMGTFGMAGIFYGPLLCIIFLTMVDIFQEYYLPKIL
jgi:predicted PurR-regulated permease PerM